MGDAKNKEMLDRLPDVKHANKVRSIEEFRDVFLPHLDKHVLDIPMTLYLPVPDTTVSTLRKQLKGYVCIMIVNVASMCGHTKRHYTQLVQLYEKYHDKGL